MTQRSPLARGDDGRRRCPWGASPEYIAYHDFEWGRPVEDDDKLFEKLCLEAFQSGLAWITILRKRDAFRAAFADFSIEAVAAFGARDVKRLMGEAGIVRNRAKIDAAIANARAAAALHESGETLTDVIWSHRPRGRRPAPKAFDEVQATTPESAALAKDLKKRSFRFVGPTTAYALMQACGLVNDHMAGCWVRKEVEEEQRAARRRRP